MNNHTKRITEGALLIALIAAGLLINRQLGGILNAYLIWIIPIPLIIYSSKYGLMEAIVVSIAAILLSFVVSSITTVFYVAGSCLIGSIYGYALKKDKSSQLLLAISMVGSLVVDYATMIIFAKFFGYDMAQDIVELQNIIKAYGVSFPSGWDLKYFIYAAIIIGSIMEGFLIHMLSYIILKRLKLKTPAFRPINKIRTPLWISICSVVVFLIYAYLGSQNVNDIRVEYLMLMLVMFMMGCLFYGYIVLITYLKAMGINKGIWVTVVLLFIFPNISIPILTGLGVLDGFIDIKGKVLNK